MDFTLTSDQQRFRDQVRAFASQHVAPMVPVGETDEVFPPEFFALLGRQGYFGCIFPRHLGGLGLGYVEYVTLIEELSRVDPSVGLLVASHTSLCSNHLYKAGNEEQKRRYLPKLATGEWIGCWSFTEPGAGSDAAGMATTGRQDGSGWLLQGKKQFTTNAQYASLGVVMAVTDPGRPQHAISAFLVERTNPGFAVGERVRTLGMRGCATSNVLLTDCHVPAENLIGERGRGFIDCLKVLDGGRISIAALSLGVAQGAYEASVAYAKQRRQFGQRIGDFQAIQHKLVEMATQIEAARLLTYKAAVACDRGTRFSMEASMAKLYASEVAVRVADEAVQIHGGYGLMRGGVPEKFLRDAKLCTIGEGTSEIQKLVIARHILADAVPALDGGPRPAREGALVG